MNITITYRTTSRVIDALSQAGKFNYTWEYTYAGTSSAKTYLCRGYKFKSTKKFAEWMINEINGWMMDLGQVDLGPIKNATYADGVKCFNF